MTKTLAMTSEVSSTVHRQVAYMTLVHTAKSAFLVSLGVQVLVILDPAGTGNLTRLAEKRRGPRVLG